MTKTDIIDGIAVRHEADLGAGGQGQAAKVALAGNPDVKLVLKTLRQPDTLRIGAMVKADLGSKCPYIAAPIAADLAGAPHRHLAPFAPGKDLLNDRPRSFPELLEAGHCLTAMITILEELGAAHGDHAPSNLKIDDDGIVWLIDVDNMLLPGAEVPKPPMAGQHMMLAPELRRPGGVTTIESDRFAMAVLLNILVLGRYPADGLAGNPASVAQVMSRGNWPEHDRHQSPGETPISALGADLIELFERAFLLDPKARPTADTWRRAFVTALDTLWIHDCGQAFVGNHQTDKCPWCGGTADFPSTVPVLKIIMPETGQKFSLPLADGTDITLGRDSLHLADPTVSSYHLRLARLGDKLFLHSLGRNGTRIRHNQHWANLDQTWLQLPTNQLQTISLRLAATWVDLELDAK